MHSPDFPDSFYRVSVKGLCVVGGKLLLAKEPRGKSDRWELPGGGLDFGEEPQVGLAREVREEMGLEVTSVSPQPLYVWTNRFENRRSVGWFYSVVLAYPMTLSHFNFLPTDECEDIGFFSRDELQTLDLFSQSMKLREVFNPLDFEKPLI